jgi:OOP family OmpA-OmpF porin
MNRLSLILAMAVTVAFTAGCTTKNYVRNQTTPIINKTNELDELTAKTTNDIRDTDTRAQQGIKGVNDKAAAADQKASVADQNATQAQQMASTVASRATEMENIVANLDQYKTMVETDVHFAFNSDKLSSKAKEALDELAGSVGSAQHFIVTVEGGADSVGSEAYNYDLSQRRAQAVIQYLASKANVPAHQIYLIGLGKDRPVADNKTSAGRAQNRRVEVRLMSNREGESQATNSNATPPQQTQQALPQQPR